MESKPLVTVVLPVHNGERYIREAIDSCLKQTYDNIEILVVNDASTDNTKNILDEYGEKIRVLDIEKQTSLGAVLNIGIRASKGSYIARIDADDIMHPTRIEKQVELLEREKDIVVVGGQVDIIDGDGNITGEREYALEDRDIRRTFFWSQPFAHPATTFRKNVASDVGLYPEDLPKVEDVDFFFKMSTRGKFANVEEKVLKYRVTFNTESQAKMVDHFWRTNVVRKEIVKKLGIKPNLRQFVLWKLEVVVVFLIQWLPHRIFMWVFELARKIFK
jgi:glycosyltransferase involved in cell wall biosynthesis